MDRATTGRSKGIEKGSSPPHQANYDLLFALLLVLLSGFALIGTAGVPFHPDESTQLFMSSDFEALAAPGSLAWSPLPQDPLRKHYRLIDAPLTRYLLGLGRMTAGLAPLPADWDWGKDWEANRLAGALPAPDLLQTGRMTITLLLPFSLLFTYLLGRKSAYPLAGLIAAALLGTSALTLLHARRAMAEGPLLFGVTLFLSTLPGSGRRPWLTGLAAALAFNAKQSAAALFPVGLLAAAWLEGGLLQDKARAIRGAVIYTAAFCLLIAALNPVWWSSPLPALRASLAERSALLERQTADAQRLGNGQYLETKAQRAAALLANLYFTPPAFAEVANYRDHTAAAEKAYLQQPGHQILRSLAGGGLLLFLTLMGMVLACLHLRRAGPADRRMLVLLLLATIFQVGFQLILVPLSWQRYAIAILPLACWWAGYAGADLGSVLAEAAGILKLKARPPSAAQAGKPGR